MAGHPRRSASSTLQAEPATLVAALKRQLRSSAQWESICQRVEGYISAQMAEGGSDGTFSDLPEVERIALIERTKRELARDGQLAELKTAVRQKLTQAQSHSSEPRDGGSVSASPSLRGGGAHHSTVSRNGGSPNAASGSRQELAAGVCQYLLLKWPHLTRQLSRYILCPFPATLRPVLWEHCLKQGTLGQRLVGDFLRDGGDPPGPSQLAGRCQHALSSCPEALLCGLKQWPHTVRLMAEAVHALTQRDGGTEEAACVLVLPFVYAHMSSVQPGVSWEEVRATVDMVVHQYSVFMQSRPWHLHSTALPVAHDAAAMFFGKVNRLLISADPELHASLYSSLTLPPREEELSVPSQDQFVRSLRDLLHPLMAQLFVGTVPMSVVCILLDQHLLSLVLHVYDPLPFCVVGLLLLTRRELLRCRNVDHVQSAIKQQGPRVTPQALLSMIKQSFAGDIAQQVKASKAKFTLKEDDREAMALRHQVHSLEALLSVSSPSGPSQGETTQASTLTGRRSGSQQSQTGSDQPSNTLTGSNQISVAVAVAGSNRGSMAGSTQRLATGSNHGTLASSTRRSRTGSNQGSVSGSNQGTVLQVEQPQGRAEDHGAIPTLSQADSGHHVSPLSSTSLHHTPLTTASTGQATESVAVTSRPAPVHVTNLVSVNVTAVPPPDAQPVARGAPQSGQAALQDAPAPPLEGPHSPPVMQHMTSTPAWSPTSDEQVDSSSNLIQTPPPSYPSTAVGRMGAPPTYDAGPIARSRAQEFWLHVLSRFSDALYLLFHGEEEEAHELERQLAADQDSVELESL